MNKMKFNSLRLLFFAFSVFFFSACGGKKMVKHYNNLSPESELSNIQSASIGKILVEYYYIKDALVATNSYQADSNAYKMKASLLGLRATFLNNDTISDGLKKVYPLFLSQTDSMITQLDAMLAANNKDCELKRIHFKSLSDVFYNFLKQGGTRNIEAYRQYCPMAMNEQGAYWLSASPEIENPYFGEKMLTCGELVDTIH